MSIKLRDFFFLKEGLCYLCHEKEYLTPYVCQECLDTFSKLDRQVHLDSQHDCYALYHYSGMIKYYLHRYKFHQETYLYRLFAELLFQSLKQHQMLKADLVAFVPSHPDNQRRHGYNPTKLIAASIAKRAGIPLSDGNLCKIKKTKAQHHLSAAERMTNLKGAFRLTAPGVLERKKILLIDDIMTTGETLREIISAFQPAKPLGIACAVVASGNALER